MTYAGIMLKVSELFSTLNTLLICYLVIGISNCSAAGKGASSYSSSFAARAAAAASQPQRLWIDDSGLVGVGVPEQRRGRAAAAASPLAARRRLPGRAPRARFQTRNDRLMALPVLQ